MVLCFPVKSFFNKKFGKTDMSLISRAFIAFLIVKTCNLYTLFNSLFNLRGVFPIQLKTFLAVMIF